MRRLPLTDVLWASVICTELSPAGRSNRKRRGEGQLEFEELGHVSSDLYERTRACALDVVRATEIHRYLAVVVENVVEFARDWELYDWWIEGMCKIRPGYNVQVVNVSAAHIYGEGNSPAPQWRDRIYIVFTRKGVRTPDLEPRPPSWCFQCETLVDGVQTWKRTDRPGVGKYGQQYLYRCPADLSVVEPLVLPAIAAIDIDDIGQRIGDRSKPLAAKTMARIEWGVEEFGCPPEDGGDGVASPVFYVKNYGGMSEAKYRAVPVTEPLGSVTTSDSHGLTSMPFMVAGYSGGVERRVKPVANEPLGTVVANGRGHHQLVTPPPFMVVNREHNRPRSAAGEPLAPMTTGNNHAVIQPFVAMLRRNGKATGVTDEPLATVTTTGRHHGLTIPPGAFYVKNYGGNARPSHLAKPLSDPLSPITTIDHHALVIPYRRGRAKTVGEPLHTLGTRQSAALVKPSISVLDCYYRMLKPREHLRAQRFFDDYVVVGNIGEQTMQAGNAVPCNVAQWIGRALMAALDVAA